MDKHKTLNPCDILTGKVTVDEFAKQFSDKIAEEVTDKIVQRTRTEAAKLSTKGR